jgi:hypothetical protein
MRNFSIYILALCLTAGCMVDYDMKPIDIIEQNRIVVNSFLNPEKPISVYFYTVNRTDTGFVYNADNNLQVKLTEDGRTLFNGLCTDTVLTLEHHPKANAKYRIDVSLTGYEPVWAETTVPTAITCKARSEHFYLSEWSYYSNSEKFFLSDFTGNYERENTSLYVLTFSLGENDTIMQCFSYYVSNVLLDPTNRTNGMEVKDKDVGSSVHDYFMRVKNRNIPYLDNLIFITDMPDSFYDYYYDEDGRHSYSKNVDVKLYLVKLITAGTDYDMYFRSFYQQKQYIVYDDEISAIFYQPIQVYSNINGGLGIFAALNESNYYFDAPSNDM